MTYSVIIPIFNEERTLQRLLDRLEKIINENIEIIIVDDGSNDNTQNILKKNNNFTILRNEINKGKGASIKRAIKSACNQNIILIDGDLEIDLNDIPWLIDKYEKSNNDVLTGIRWNKYSQFKLEINTIGNYLINALFNLLYKTKFSDVLCCLKILDINLIRSLNIRSNGFNIEIETMAKLVLKKSKIEEVDINYTRRSINDGKKLKISDGWGIIWSMIKLKIINQL